MGNWAITIIGTGAHHNKEYLGDANRIFKKVVDELKAAGQNVEHASFTHGARDVERPNCTTWYPPQK